MELKQEMYSVKAKSVEPVESPYFLARSFADSPFKKPCED